MNCLPKHWHHLSGKFAGNTPASYTEQVPISQIGQYAFCTPFVLLCRNTLSREHTCKTVTMFMQVLCRLYRFRNRLLCLHLAPSPFHSHILACHFALRPHLVNEHVIAGTRLNQVRIFKLFCVLFLSQKCGFKRQSLPRSIRERPAILYHQRSRWHPYPIDLFIFGRVAIYRRHTGKGTRSNRVMVPLHFPNSAVKSNGCLLVGHSSPYW